MVKYGCRETKLFLGFLFEVKYGRFVLLLYRSQGVENADALEKKLTEVVGQLIQRGVTVFYFGSRSAFDDLAKKVVSLYKEEGAPIKRIYIRSSYPNISDQYRDFLLKSYEDTYMPQGVERAGKASYVERNQAMITASDICVFYYKEDYAPARRKRAKKDLTDYQPKSGTSLAFAFAVSQGKEIINVAD